MSKTFEDHMKDMATLSESDMKAKVKEIQKVCKDYCGKCPTRAGTGEKGLAFCALGKSQKIKVDKGCLCAGCPITKQLALRWDHYCMKGSGREQAGMK